jgi:hypothetical protein
MIRSFRLRSINTCAGQHKKNATTCGPSSAPLSSVPRPSVSRHNSVMKMATPAPSSHSPATSPGWRRAGNTSSKNRKRKKSQRRVSLHGMQRNAQRRAAPARGQRIVYVTAQRTVVSVPYPEPASSAPSCSKASPSASGAASASAVAAKRHPLPARIYGCAPARQRPCAGQQRMMNHGQSQHPSGMRRRSLQLTAISRSRSPQAPQTAPITHRFHTCAAFTFAMRAVRCARNSASNTPSADIAPYDGMSKFRADVKENWMHLSQNTASGLARR